MQTPLEEEQWRFLAHFADENQIHTLLETV
jgi:hypothetical protein